MSADRRPLLAYFVAGDLSPMSKEHNTRLFIAGEMVCRDYERGGLGERQREALDCDFSGVWEDQTSKRWLGAMAAAGIYQVEVHQCCCLGQPVAPHRMSRLRAGLAEIASFYRVH